MKNKDLEKVIYMWFNLKYELYSRLDYDDSIYLYHEGEEYADIRIDKKCEYIYYEWNIWREFSDVFPIERDEFKEVISKWVENTFNLMRFTPSRTHTGLPSLLKIPLI